jgi:hypothetical protein
MHMLIRFGVRPSRRSSGPPLFQGAGTAARRAFVVDRLPAGLGGRLAERLCRLALLSAAFACSVGCRSASDRAPTHVTQHPLDGGALASPPSSAAAIDGGDASAQSTVSVSCDRTGDAAMCATRPVDDHNHSNGDDGGERAGDLRDASAVQPIAPNDASTSPLDHDFFSTVSVAETNSASVASQGDLWVNCWSDDDALYVANGDGAGFGTVPVDIAVSRIDGRPTDTLSGTALASAAQVGPVWNGVNYNRKPTGMLCQNGDLYLAVQDLRVFTFDDAPAATIVRSTDKGLTFSWDSSAPMFSDHVFTTIMFLDFGKDSEHAIDDFVYAYAFDNNWAFNATGAPPTQLFLGRVPRDHVQDRTLWQFFSGLDAQGSPLWTDDIASRAPVLEDTRRLYTTPVDPTLAYQNMTVLSQGGVVYDAPLSRYIFTSWTEYTFEFYEAPNPWGPFTHFYSKDFGVFPWSDMKSGGYGTTIPSKFIAADGGSMWLQSNAWQQSGSSSYQFSLRELHLTPYVASEARNEQASGPVSTADYGAVPFVRALHYGDVGILNDGVLTGQSEDSSTGDCKTEDFWGYTWPQLMHLNTLRYTTGAMAADGGWFSQSSVQVRHGKDWVAVHGLHVSPAFPNDASLPDHTTYTFSFDAEISDGVRVWGTPGGSSYYTSIAELTAHYE